ncbi:unnamed protein product [Symbiodinium microadriaticum]|nr:unnamed protein product [Symbiodinium microadriaticum]
MPPLKKPAALAAKAKAKGTKKEEAVLKKPAAKEADKEGGKGKGRALSIDKWLEALRPYSLTVADIEKLKPGEELTCYVFDRNVGDMCDTAVFSLTFHDFDDDIDGYRADGSD